MDPLAFSTDDDVSSGSAPGSSSPSGFFNPGSDPNADPNQVLNVRHPESPYGLIQEVLPALSNQWVMLKRYLWRWGLLDQAHDIPERWSLLSDAPSPH